MRLGITAKLFLGVLATSVLVALVMAVTGQLAFQRDFRRYVEAAEARRSEALAETLASVYADSGGWAALAGADRRWRALLRAQPRPAETGRDETRRGPGRGWPRVALYDVNDALVVGNPPGDGEVSRYAVEVNGETVGWIV